MKQYLSKLELFDSQTKGEGKNQYMLRLGEKNLEEIQDSLERSIE